jgi:hypothetical protein
MKKLKTLEEHNTEVLNRVHSTKNGIECPRCGSELDDENPGMVYPCSPPKCDIKCFNCGYTGMRYCD